MPVCSLEQEQYGTIADVRIICEKNDINLLDGRKIEVKVYNKKQVKLHVCMIWYCNIYNKIYNKET